MDKSSSLTHYFGGEGRSAPTPICEAAAGGIPCKNLLLSSSGSMQTNQVLLSKH